MKHPVPSLPPAKTRLFQGILPLKRSAISKDIIGGIVLAAIGIPEVMGYTKIAGTPIATGWYTLIFPVLMFAILGSSRHLIVAADSATAAILAAGLSGLAPLGSAHYLALAQLVAILVSYCPSAGSTIFLWGLVWRKSGGISFSVWLGCS
jgi:sulfate permease, SulP family